MPTETEIPMMKFPWQPKNGIKQLYYLMTGFGYDTNSLWYTDDSGKVHYAAVEDQYKRNAGIPK